MRSDSANNGDGAHERQEPGDVTNWLLRANDGDEDAANAAYDASYSRLRAHARRILRRRHGDHTLEPEGLLHEAFLKLTRHGAIEWQSRGHFIAVMSRTMRQILLDYEKDRGAVKRGRHHQRVPLTERLLPFFETRQVELLALHDALGRLGELDRGAAEATELRCFLGLSVSEVAAALNRSKRSIERDLEFARTWLAGELLDDGD